MSTAAMSGINDCSQISNAATSSCIRILTPVSNSEFRWSTNTTKLLLDLYAKYRKKVGQLNLRTLKQMWQLIAEELNVALGTTTINASNCENRWKVLERNYKKHVENQNSTGRGRKVFDFAEEMENILGKKKSIHPQLLLNSTAVTTECEIQEKAVEDPDIPENTAVHEVATEEIENANKSNVIRRRTTKQRKSLYETIRLDRLKYQEKKLQLETAKYNELVRRNNLIEERNAILKEQKCCCQHNHT